MNDFYLIDWLIFFLFLLLYFTQISYTGAAIFLDLLLIYFKYIWCFYLLYLNQIKAPPNPLLGVFYSFTVSCLDITPDSHLFLQQCRHSEVDHCPVSLLALLLLVLGSRTPSRLPTLTIGYTHQTRVCQHSDCVLLLNGLFRAELAQGSF